MRVRLTHLPEQARFYNAPEPIAAFVAGVGYGKTYVASDWILTGAAKYPRARHFIFSNTYPQLKSGTLKSFFERCDDWGLRYVDRVHSDKEIRLPQLGATIEVRSADRPINFKSLEICRAWIDEGQGWNQWTYEALIGRLRGTTRQRQLYPNMPLEVRLTANPPHSMDHWLVDKCTEPSPETGKPPIALYTASTFDNPFLPQSYIDMLLENYDPELAAIELGGKFGDLRTGRIWRKFARKSHVLTPAQAAALGLPALDWDPNLPVCWSHDFNVDPLSSVLFQWRRVDVAGFQTEVMYVLDELRIRSAVIDDAVHEFLRRDAARIARRAGLILYGDPAGNQQNRQTGESDWVALRNGLAKQGLRGEVRVPKGPPLRRDRYNAGNRKLEDFYGRIGVVIRADTCRYLPRDLERMYYKPGTSDVMVPKLVDGDPSKLITHLADAWSYPIAQEYPVIDKPPPPIVTAR